MQFTGQELIKPLCYITDLLQIPDTFYDLGNLGPLMWPDVRLVKIIILFFFYRSNLLTETPPAVLHTVVIFTLLTP